MGAESEGGHSAAGEGGKGLRARNVRNVPVMSEDESDRRRTWKGIFRGKTCFFHVTILYKHFLLLIVF